MTPELIRKVAVGDSLSDDELSIARRFYQKMADGLELLGPDHRLSWRDVSSTLSRLDMFFRARAMSGRLRKESGQ